MSAARLNPMIEMNGRALPGRSSQTITLAFVLDALRRWWKIALPAGLILAAAAASVVFVLFEPVYRASSWLQIEDTKPYVAFPDRQNSRGYVETQKQLILSPMVLGPVISDPRIARLPELAEVNDPFEELQKVLKVETRGDSEILLLTFEGPDPKNAADIVNAVTDSYLNLHAERDSVRTQQVIKMLQGKQSEEATRLKDLQNRFRDLTEKLTGENPFVKERILKTDPLSDLQTKLADVEVQRMFLEAQASVLAEEIKEEKIDVPGAELEEVVSNDPELQQLQAGIEANRAKLVEFEKVLVNAKEDAGYRRTSEEIKRDEELLAKKRQEIGHRVVARMKSTMMSQRKDALAAMQASIKEYERMESTLKARCASEETNTSAKAGWSADLEFQRTELERAEKVYDKITERLEQLQTERQAPAQVTLSQKAAVPAAPIEAHPLKKMLVFGLGMFCVPFVLVVVWERLVGRVSDTLQFEQASRLAVIGEIARLPVRTGVFHAVSASRTSQDISLFEESIDSLRTYLVLSEALRDLRVLAVTSSVNSEGKTSVAVQLAVSIARASGQPTLLIDGDMRSPDVHAKLDIPLEPGLAEVLGRQCTLEEALVTDWSNYLHLLPAGRLHCSPHKLLGNGSVKPLFDAVRQSYRYVIVDTPPILAASEALVLAKAADAALICAMRDVSRLDQIRRTESRLTAAGTPLVGVVLNAVPTSRYAYRYGSYAYSRD